MKCFERFFKLLAIALLVLVMPLMSMSPAEAAPQPYNPLPPITVKALPTVQVDGIVWAEAMYGNTVYATGHFNYARPAGAAPGVNQVVRTNLLAFDITTGQLITSFNHSLTASDGSNTKTNTAGRSISVAPDGSRLYVGGVFQKVDGQSHSNLVAIDLKTNQIVPNFVGTNGMVKALAATTGGLFVGGSFSEASGQPRSNLAAYTLKGHIRTDWTTGVSLSNGQPATVWSILVLSDKIVIGGSYDTISDVNGSSAYYGSGAVDRTTGLRLPWASESTSYPMRFFTKDGAATSLTTDGKYIFLTGLTYDTGGVMGGTFEGRAAISKTDGSLVWINDCYGDTYDAIPIGQVLFSVGHAHDCSAIGDFPEARPGHHVLAETTYPTGTNGHPTTDHGYADYAGLPDSTQLNWYPFLNQGSVSGQYQASWTITGNSSYLAVGGEFTQAENMKQQGLVRYAISGVTPAAETPKTTTPQPVKRVSTTPAPQQTVTIDDTDPTISYRGTWTNSANRGRGDYDNGVHFTQTNGDSATYTFTGTSVSVLTEASNLRGNMAISINGGTPVIVNAYSNTTASQDKIFTKTGLANTTHTVKVTKLSGDYMVIDGFIVTR